MALPAMLPGGHCNRNRARIFTRRVAGRRREEAGAGSRQALPERAIACTTCTANAEQDEMSKQDMREEAERLVKEAMARKGVTVKQGDTRIEAKCGKCGAPNRVTASPGQSRVEFKCKECGAEQRTL
jgi:hypothetical protein